MKSILIPILINIFIVVATMSINHILQKYIIKISQKNNFEQSILKALQILVYIFIYTMGIILILDNFHIKISAFMKALGFLTIGISFALQQTLANLACGFFLLFNKPFFIGDYISSSSPKFQGKIIDINLQFTKLIDEKNIIIVPNHTVYNAVVTITKNSI